MKERRKLTDILHGSERDKLSEAWTSAKPASDFIPLPPGIYIARIDHGTLATAKTGTPSYKLTFKIVEGEHTGRRIFHDIWLTEAAMPMAKRDLAKLGVTALQQLDQPLPQGFRCKVKLALRRDDNGNEYNQVRSFEVLGIDQLEEDTFDPPSAVAQAKDLFPESANGAGAGPYKEGY